MVRDWFVELVDLIVPPRSTERLVRGLTLEKLQRLAQEDGLPYREPEITALIWELKYYANPRAEALCGAYLAEPLLAAAAEEIGTPLLLPVPMHAARRRARGHNHAERLCRAAHARLGNALQHAPRALERVRDTPTQQGLPRSERLRNVAHSMQAAPFVRDRACIVVDDVTTTGATLEEAVRALRAAGARSVQTVALARS